MTRYRRRLLLHFIDAGRIGNVVLVDDKLDILKVIRHGEVLC